MAHGKGCSCPMCKNKHEAGESPAKEAKEEKFVRNMKGRKGGRKSGRR